MPGSLPGLMFMPVSGKRSTRSGYALVDHLAAISGQGTGKTIWFTGHSLAALATLAVDRFKAGNVGGLYTFGSPRVGDKVFQVGFTPPCYRFVNNTDIIPHLPPPTVLADYAHVGNLRFIDSAGRIVSDPTTFDMIASNLRGHFQSVKAAFDTFTPSKLREAGQVIIDAFSQRGFLDGGRQAGGARISTSSQ